MTTFVSAADREFEAEVGKAKVMLYALEGVEATYRLTPGDHDPFDVEIVVDGEVVEVIDAKVRKQFTGDYGGEWFVKHTCLSNAWRQQRSDPDHKISYVWRFTKSGPELYEVPGEELVRRGIEASANDSWKYLTRSDRNEAADENQKGIHVPFGRMQKVWPPRSRVRAPIQSHTCTDCDRPGLYPKPTVCFWCKQAAA